MSRSPLFLPMNRGMDMEVGGAADLQTDVMRFMAIISLCLVAIFALVQSIPLATVTEIVPPDMTVRAEPPAVQDVRKPPQTIPVPQTELARPKPAQKDEPDKPVILQRPSTVKSKPVAQISVVEPQPALQQTTVVSRETSDNSPIGFTLRFESDQVLTRLIEQDSVGLFAIDAGRSLRLSIDTGRMSFWPSPSPRTIHEMDVDTVPQAVLDAYERTDGFGRKPVKWGVSIPATMSRQLDQILTEREGGALVISADGALHLE